MENKVKAWKKALNSDHGYGCRHMMQKFYNGESSEGRYLTHFFQRNVFHESLTDFCHHVISDLIHCASNIISIVLHHLASL